MTDDPHNPTRRAVIGSSAAGLAGAALAGRAAAQETGNAIPAPPASVRIRPLEVQRTEYSGAHFLPENDANLLRPDLSRAEAVTFPAIDGTRLAAHVFVPEGTGPHPAVALCGPISAVKEQVTSIYAQKLADAGYLAVTFDPRRFGESGGEPRYLYDPSDVIADFHAAVRHLFSRTDVDPDRVGAVGVCMGGGYAVSLGAREKRLKAISAVAGGYDIGATFQLLQGVEGFADFLAQLNTRIQEQVETGEVQYIPTSAESTDTLAALPNAEAHSFYTRTAADYAPNWSDEFAAMSLEPYFAYTAVDQAPLVAPTPIQFVHGTLDVFLLPQYAQDAYDHAQGTKELVWIDTHNHIELYDQDPYVSHAVEHIVRWLDAHMAADAGGGSGQ